MMPAIVAANSTNDAAMTTPFVCSARISSCDILPTAARPERAHPPGTVAIPHRFRLAVLGSGARGPSPDTSLTIQSRSPLHEPARACLAPEDAAAAMTGSSPELDSLLLGLVGSRSQITRRISSLADLQQLFVRERRQRLPSGVRKAGCPASRCRIAYPRRRIGLRPARGRNIPACRRACSGPYGRSGRSAWCPSRFGQAEVDDLGDRFAVHDFDEDIARFQIAVDDTFLMGVLHGVAHRDEQQQPVAAVQLVIAIPRDGTPRP